MAMNDYDIEELPEEKEVYMIAATCGQGEHPANCKYFHEDLSQADLDLSGVKFATFGLGDTSYIHYNSVAKEFDSRFEELGAKRILPIGLGNDKDDEKYETAWYEWFPELAIEAKLPPPPEELLPSIYDFETEASTELVRVERFLPPGT